jgi:hypothetical protein
MQWQKIFFPIAGVLLVVLAFDAAGWRGVFLVASAFVTWLLWQFSRFLGVLRRAARHPVGQVASVAAVHARLKAGLPLLNVLGMTQSLGKLESEEKAQPEIYSWVDDTLASLRCTFVDGKLARWSKEAAPEAATAPAAALDANP